MLIKRFCVIVMTQILELYMSILIKCFFYFYDKSSDVTHTGTHPRTHVIHNFPTDLKPGHDSCTHVDGIR